MTVTRKEWMGAMARAPEGRVAALLADTGLTARFDWLRRPEVGAVMVQGRMGGTGAPFNMGEMTVTRCALKLATGQVGHGYVQGRSKSGAEAAAMVDALLQTDAGPSLHDRIVTPLLQDEADRRQRRAEKAAATKVDFFTMTRGED